MTPEKIIQLLATGWQFADGHYFRTLPSGGSVMLGRIDVRAGVPLHLAGLYSAGASPVVASSYHDHIEAIAELAAMLDESARTHAVYAARYRAALADVTAILSELTR